MAKRSPILGYNHNVRFRGLIFHVQTEDSGVLSPHLFTHLFHAGVIVSTRKLVYDAGSDEGAIKSLMQAQHKAVMKDLKKGTFDEKIDQYLGDTPGLLPRGAGAVDESQPMDGRDSQPVLARPSEPSLEPVTEAMAAPPAEIDATIRNLPAVDLSKEAPADINATLRGTTPARAQVAREPVPRAPTAPAITPQATALDDDDDLGLGHFTSAPKPRTWLEEQSDTDPHRDAVPRAQTQPDAPRTQTADRGSAPSSVRGPMLPPPPSDDDGIDGPTNLDSAAIAAAMAQNNATIRMPMPVEPGTSDSMNQIIGLELDHTPSGRTRPRDTDVVLPGVDPEPTSDGVPARPGSRSRPNESVPPLPPPPMASRPSASGSLLPPRSPTKQPARQAIAPPQVVSRPITHEDAAGRQRRDSDAVEVYAPAPPSAEAPPGAASERPGQYAQYKRISQRMPAVEPPSRERSGAVPIPPGLGRPGNRLHPQSGSTAKPPPTPPPREPKTTSQPIPTSVRGEKSSGATARPRTPTPSRPGSPSSRPVSNPIPSSGVVMTRPAVIVGAPARPAQPSRARKAREDEGRGFGQGLISEKSLDEVILAYLSEDADDK